MINIFQSQINNTVIKFAHNLPTPVYLFAAKNQATCKEKTFISANISPSSEYKEYNIEEAGIGIEDLLNGKVKLNPSGFWILEIYEQASNTNLDKSLATLLHTEKLNIISDVICN